jgi:hypothetical protein
MKACDVCARLGNITGIHSRGLAQYVRGLPRTTVRMTCADVIGVLLTRRHLPASPTKTACRQCVCDAKLGDGQVSVELARVAVGAHRVAHAAEGSGHVVGDAQKMLREAISCNATHKRTLYQLGTRWHPYSSRRGRQLACAAGILCSRRTTSHLPLSGARGRPTRVASSNAK